MKSKDVFIAAVRDNNALLESFKVWLAEERSRSLEAMVTAEDTADLHRAQGAVRKISDLERRLLAQLRGNDV